LYLTPAAVSARIKHLEEYFNAILFTRARNRIHLTPAGEKLLPYATEMVEKLKQARHLLSEQEAEFIILGATPNAACLALDHVLETCRETFQSTPITAEIHCNEQLSRQLHERSIDFAFTTEVLKSASIQSMTISRQPLYLYQSKAQGKGSKNVDFVHINWSSQANVTALAAQPSLRHYQFKTNDATTAINFINQYGGNIILPTSLKHRLKSAEQVELEEIGSVSLYCVSLKEHPHPMIETIVPALTKAGICT
jgi:DNA-binding transcriptional LysR family regulator